MDKDFNLTMIIIVILIGFIIVVDGNKINKINEEIEKLDFKIQMLETNNEINAKLILRSNNKMKEMMSTSSTNNSNSSEATNS